MSQYVKGKFNSVSGHLQIIIPRVFSDIFIKTAPDIFSDKRIESVN